MSSHELPSIRVCDSLDAVAADLLVVPVFEQDEPRSLPLLDAAVRDEWIRAAASRELTGKPFEHLLISAGRESGVLRAVLIGVGPRAQFGADAARRLGGAAGLFARQRRAPRVAVLLRTAGNADAGDASGAARLTQALAEGLTLAQYEIGAHRTSAPEIGRIEALSIVLDRSVSADGVQPAADRGRILGDCTNLARALANEPANLLTPSQFSERAASIAAGTGLTFEVLDEEAIAQLGMGLLMGVAKGSSEPPRLIVLKHEPEVRPDAPTLGLIGKGITFDTGGISIKPADGMEKMKVDMGGGAAVIAAMRALALLHAPARAIAVVPSTENMPGGRALKPGDVLRSAAGKTVEVVNTDAEGRLVLADAMWYARELGASHLVDAATLTGACVIALGRAVAGLFGRPDDWVDRVRRAALIAGEAVWPMPLFADYSEQLKSEVADLTNTGGRPAGAITAALFLQQFAGDVPWAHLDIAGPVWNDEPRPWLAKGATGAGVRTLAELGLAFSG
jgi:leucyl aminopeptidase